MTPALRDGLRCVIVRRQLAELEPRLFKFFLSFALDNELQITFDADAVATLLPDTVRRMSRTRHRRVPAVATKISRQITDIAS